jgi:hypothetical protein
MALYLARQGMRDEVFQFEIRPSPIPEGDLVVVRVEKPVDRRLPSQARKWLMEEEGE